MEAKKGRSIELEMALGSLTLKRAKLKDDGTVRVPHHAIMDLLGLPKDQQITANFHSACGSTLIQAQLTAHNVKLWRGKLRLEDLRLANPKHVGGDQTSKWRVFAVESNLKDLCRFFCDCTEANGPESIIVAFEVTDTPKFGFEEMADAEPEVDQPLLT